MRRLTLILVSIIIMLSASNGKAASENKKKHTILLYMLGCDLEEEHGSASSDILEIMHATGKDKNVQIFICLGGSKNYYLPELKSNCSYILYITEGQMQIISEHSDNNLANGFVLQNFIQQFGSDGTNLIIWGHGCPGLNGVGYDSYYPDDTLSLIEIMNAIHESEIRFRVIGIDACRMASFEAACMLTPYCDSFIASPDDEPLGGWNYSTMISWLATDDTAPLYSRNNHHLTMLSSADLISASSEIIKIFDTCSSSSGILTLADAARNCTNRGAGEVILQMTDISTLWLACVSDITEQAIQYLQVTEPVYLSFILRQ